MLMVLHKGFLLFPNTHTLPVDLWSVCSVLYFMDDGKKKSDNMSSEYFRSFHPTANIFHT